MMTPKVNSINEYIAPFPKDVQKLLEQMRLTIKKAAPKAEEVISYGMPAFKQDEILVYFAGYKNHIGFYPTSSGIRNFQKEIARYKNSKGAVQFPLDKPLPLTLITKIVKFRVKEDMLNNKAKKDKSKDELFAPLSAPAMRALQNNGIRTIHQLSSYSKKELLSLHGLGPSTIPALQKILKSKGLDLKK